MQESKGQGQVDSRDTEPELRGKEASVGASRQSPSTHTLTSPAHTFWGWIVDGNLGTIGKERGIGRLSQGLIRPAYQQDFYSICRFAASLTLRLEMLDTRAIATARG